MFDLGSDTPFGPVCVSDREAWNLIGHIQRTLDKDPRACDATERMIALSELRGGDASDVPTHPNRICDCGSGREIIYKIYQDTETLKRCEKCWKQRGLRAKYLTNGGSK